MGTLTTWSFRASNTYARLRDIALNNLDHTPVGRHQPADGSEASHFGDFSFCYASVAGADRQYQTIPKIRAR